MLTAMPNDKKNGYLNGRRISAYPPPQTKGMVEAYSATQEMTKSEVVNLALKQFFCGLPQDIKTQLRQHKSKNGY